jgi:hypothetical protein
LLRATFASVLKQLALSRCVGLYRATLPWQVGAPPSNAAPLR